MQLYLPSQLSDNLLKESSPVQHTYQLFTLSTFLKYLYSHNQLKHPLTLKLQEHVAEAHQLAVVA